MQIKFFSFLFWNQTMRKRIHIGGEKKKGWNYSCWKRCKQQFCLKKIGFSCRSEIKMCFLRLSTFWRTVKMEFKTYIKLLTRVLLEDFGLKNQCIKLWARKIRLISIRWKADFREFAASKLRQNSISFA